MFKVSDVQGSDIFSNLMTGIVENAAIVFSKAE